MSITVYLVTPLHEEGPKSSADPLEKLLLQVAAMDRSTLESYGPYVKRMAMSLSRLLSVTSLLQIGKGQYNSFSEKNR